MAKDFRRDEETKTKNQARLIGYKYIDSRQLDMNKVVKDLFPLDMIRNQKVVPLGRNGQQIVVGITIKTSKQVIAEIKKNYPDYSFSFVMISEVGLMEYLQILDPPVEATYNDIEISSEGAGENIDAISKSLEQVRADDILDYLITQADQLNASDIHYETQEDKVRIRFRIDGALHAIAEISHEKAKQLQNAVAIAGNVSINSTTAQTGHWTQEVEEADGSKKDINMRIETVNTNYGQDAVIRLFTIEQELLNLDSMRLRENHHKSLSDVVSNPHGMILVVGPTGSGKTTTMYSLLNGLNVPQRKIVTLEDPVEYAIAGISQIPVASRQGESFAEGLRAVLRLDPDVLMVGEIRDSDTAKTALQASLTGHLVLSTFHASDAATAFSRLLDIIDYNPLLLGAIRMVMAQRLVRRLDDTTKIEYQPSQAEVDQIKSAFANVPDNFQVPDIDNAKLYKPGTSEENPFGYKGRQVVMEQIHVTEELQDRIRKQGNETSSHEIEEIARQSGFISLRQDAMLRVLGGETSLAEVVTIVG